MAAAKSCPACAAPLPPAPADAAKWKCPACGVRLASRSARAVSVPAKAPNPFRDLEDSAPPPAAKAAPGAPAGGRDPRIFLALAVGGLLAAVVVGLGGLVALAVLFTPHAAVPATPVASVPTPADPPPGPPARRPLDLPAEPPPAPVPPPAKAERPPSPPDPPPPAPADPKPAPVNAPPPPDPPTPTDAVGAAVTKAVSYLKDQANNDLAGDRYRGNRTGVMALIGLALLESGVPADDPAVQKAITVVRGQAPTLQNTYEMSLCVWFLDRLGDARDEDLIQSLAVQLIAGQGGGGLWDYSSPTVGAAAQKEILEVLGKYDVGTAIPAKAGLPPVCQYHRGKKLESVKPADAPGAGRFAPGLFPGMPATFANGDLSLTQFAVLALWVARKHHVPSDRSLLLAEAYCRAKQTAEGSWSYKGLGDYMRDSMTCAGLMALAVGRGTDQAKDAKPNPDDQAVKKALVFLADVFDRGIPAGAKPQGNADALRAAVTQVQQAYTTMTAKQLFRKTIDAKSLADYKAVVKKASETDVPDDAKKHLAQILAATKKYGDAPTEANKQELMTATTTFTFAVPGLAFPGGEGKRFLTARPPVDQTWDDIYFLWSMERMAVVYDFKTIAGHDWYAWGADLLVGYQNDDGSWSNAYSGAVDTGLALLFLKRVNVAKDLTSKLQLVGIHDVKAPGDKSLGELLAPNLNKDKDAPLRTAPPDKP